MEESSSGKKTTRRPMFLLVSVVVFVALDFGFDLAKKPIFVSACLCGCENAGKFLTLVLFLDALEMINERGRGVKPFADLGICFAVFVIFAHDVVLVLCSFTRVVILEILYLYLFVCPMFRIYYIVI